MVDVHVKTDLRVHALEDIWAFGELIDFKGGMDTFSSLHKEICEFVTTPQLIGTPLPRHRRRLILVAREHRKSTLGNVLYTMWRLYRNPNLRFGVGCNTKNLSRAFIRELRFYFENEVLQEDVWNNRPHIQGRMVPLMYRGSKRRPDSDDTEAADRKLVWNQYALQLVRPKILKEPSVEAVSVGMTLTGQHYDVIVLDDIVDFDNSSTPTKASNVEEWAEDLESVLAKTAKKEYITDYFSEYVGDELIILGTTYYKWDYYHTHFLGRSFDIGVDHTELEQNLEEKEYIALIKNIYVNSADNKQGYVFPELMDDQVVRRLKKRIKNRRFSAQFLLKVVSDDDSVGMDADAVQYILEKDLRKTGYGVVEYVKNAVEVVPIQLYMVVDLAVSLKAAADNSAIGVGGYDKDNNFYCVDLFAQRVPPSRLINEIYRIADKWGLSVVYIEIGGFQEAFVHQLREEYSKPGRRPLSIVTYTSSGNKKERITHGLEPLITNRMFFTHHWIMAKTPLKEELDLHPSESATDDCLDVLEVIARVAQRSPRHIQSDRSKRTRHLVVNKKYGGQR